jgi:signal transduction histidine kinase
MFLERSAPRGLVTLIAAITLVPMAILLWLGWRLVEQDRILENQQIQQRIERAADMIVASLQRVIAESEQRLDGSSDQWPDGAVELFFRDGIIEAHPKDRVAYFPVAPPLREAPDAVFAQAEDLEFRRQDHFATIDALRKLTNSSDFAVRAGAQIRLARNLRSVGRLEEALNIYTQLAQPDGTANDVSIDGVPASLVALQARCKLLEELKHRSELVDARQQLEDSLSAGRWMLTGPVYRLYAQDTGKRQPQREMFAAAVEALWEKYRSMPLAPSKSTGRESLTVDGQVLALVWHASGGSFRALIAAPAFVEREWLAASAPVLKEQAISVGLGAAGPGTSLNQSPRTVRTAAETSLPWNVVISSANPGFEHDAFVLRRRLMLAGFIILVGMALVASYLIVRAINRELAVTRLQSHFTAAVSHEFRTPLTSLRQFTDRLREHHNLDEADRRLCYEAQSRATDRLTRLVESLLDFGRMEAGARPYRLERCDCGELLRSVVENFRREARAAGYEIAFCGNGRAPVEADREALSSAVWNLLDNAVKYSPDHHRVEVGLTRRHSHVLISVRDNGIGIPAKERAAIFTRFGRGEEARARGIKGTGIGLAMVDHIVKAHHGCVEVESEPGKGSTFTIVLPLND